MSHLEPTWVMVDSVTASLGKTYICIILENLSLRRVRPCRTALMLTSCSCCSARDPNQHLSPINFCKSNDRQVSRSTRTTISPRHIHYNINTPASSKFECIGDQ